VTDPISPATAAFLDEVMPVIVGVRRADGTVAMNPAWYEFLDGRFWLNSWRGARWLEHLERERRASMLFVDPADMHRVVRVSASLARTDTEGAAEHVDRLSHRYRGEPYRSPSPQRRVLIELVPTRVRSTLPAPPSPNTATPVNGKWPAHK